MNPLLRSLLFDDPLFKRAGLQYVWPLDEATGFVRQSYSPPWACVPSAHLLPVNGPTQGAALISGPAGACDVVAATPSYLTAPNQPSLTPVNVPFWFALWYKQTANTGLQGVLGKYGSGGYLFYTTGGFPTLVIYGNAQPQWGSAPAAGVKHLAVCYFDPVGLTGGISIDGGNYVTGSCAAGLISSSLAMEISTTQGSLSRFSGTIGPVMMGFPRPGFRNWVSLRDTLYANGSGLDLVRRMPLATNVVGPVPGIRPLAWWKADGVNYQTAGGSPATADGDPVGYFTDFSGMNIAPTATGTHRPTLKTAIQNGLPVFRFDATDDYASYTLPGAVAGSPLHVFVVAKTTGGGGANQGVLMDISGNIKSFAYNDPSGVPVFCGAQISAGDTTALTSGDIDGTNFVLLTGKINNASSAIRVNGTEVASGNAGGTRNGIVLYLGNDSSLSRFFQGDIAEMLIYGGNLSSTDEQAVEAYLNAKWAVY